MYGLLRGLLRDDLLHDSTLRLIVPEHDQESRPHQAASVARVAPFVAVKRVRRKLKLTSWNSSSIVAALVVPRASKTLFRVLDRILK